MIELQLEATRALQQVLGGRSLTGVLPQSRARLTDAGAAMQDIVFGVLRHLGLLRAVLNELSGRRVEDEDLQVLLLVAIYQLEFTRAAQHAIVDQAVSASIALRKSSAKGLVNAVLRNFLRRRQSILDQARATESGRWSHPQWWIDALKTAYPACFVEILAAGNDRPPMTLRVNLRKADPNSYLKLLAESAFNAHLIGPVAIRLDQPVAVDRLPGFNQGLVSVQDLAAQYAAPLLDLREGQRVLDACAAPGGKTAHIAECCDVDLTAIELDPERLQRIVQTLERLGLSAARLISADAGAVASWWDGVPFDRILLDAPCTGSGIVRRHPDIKWLRRPADVDTLAAQQHALLDALWRVLAHGGKLLYATCSVFPQETELQLTAFLEAHPDAKRLALPEIAGIGNFKGQILPDSRHDGFFYALLQKA